MDSVHSDYRFLLSDLMPFGRNARITLEHGGLNTESEHYETVTYWYGLDQACLTLVDAFDVGSTQDEHETSNRRWREDEFLIGPQLTRGRERIRVRIEPMPVGLPLFPGRPVPEEAWTAFHCWTYAYVMPGTAEHAEQE